MAKITNFTVAGIGAAGFAAVKLAEESGSAEVTSCPAFTNLKDAHQRFMVSLGKRAGSLDTITVAQADKLRRKALVGLRQTVYSKIYWPDPSIAAAAARMKGFLGQNSKSIEAQPYSEESVRLHALLKKLAEPEQQQDIAALAVEPLVEQLAQAQQRFEAIQRTRSEASAAESEIPTASTMRRELEDAIRGFTQYAEAMALVNPASAWEMLRLTIRQRLAEIEAGHRPKRAPKQPVNPDSPGTDSTEA